MRLSHRLAYLIPCLLLSLLFWDRPELWVNADQMMPAAITWDLQHHTGVLSHFRFSRVLSLFPDILVFGVLQAIIGDWRLAYAIWLTLMLIWLVTISGRIAGMIARVPRSTATLAALLLIALTLGGSLALREVAGFSALIGHGSPWGFMMPLNHGGPFLLSLTALAVINPAGQTLTTARLAWMASLSFAGALSDLLFIAVFCIPLTIATLGRLHAGATSAGFAGRLLAGGWIGGLAGWAASTLFSHQPVPFPSPDAIAWHVAIFLIDLGRFPAIAVLLAGGMLCITQTFARHDLRQDLAAFWPAFSAAAMLAGVGLAVLLYQDPQSYRYAMPSLWWFVILMSAGLARWLARLLADRPAVLHRAAAALSVMLALSYPMTRWHVPRLLTWRSTMAECLRQAGLRAGLAEFWYAGTTAAGSDWSIQVQPLTPEATARFWADDPRWFLHDISDWTHRPEFRFIIMAGLLAEQVATIYGRPDRVLPCAGSEVWVFDDPTHLFQRLLHASPELHSVETGNDLLPWN